MLGEGLVSCTSEERKPKRGTAKKKPEAQQKVQPQKNRGRGSKAQGKASTKAAQTPEGQMSYEERARAELGLPSGKPERQISTKTEDKERERRRMNQVTSQARCALIGPSAGLTHLKLHRNTLRAKGNKRESEP